MRRPIRHIIPVIFILIPFGLVGQTPVLSWTAGSDTVNQQTLFETLPGARKSSITWTDTSGDLWLFGGFSFDDTGGINFNDLWHYDPVTGQWTWMAGSDIVNQPGVFGTKGIGSNTNVPGARYNSISWTDVSGNLWLFGGIGYDRNGLYGILNDLWRYDPASEEWTWMGGSDAIDQPGIYGTKGIGSNTNVPGARTNSISWTDVSGNFWLFGGYGYDSNGSRNFLNDLWRYNPTTEEWTWMTGSDVIDQIGVYGIKGIGSTTNIPGARYKSISWIDGSGNSWLFGGHGYDSNGSYGYLNDLWRYNPATGEWTWMAGTDIINQTGNYGTLGIGSTTNIPGARNSSISWTDGTGNLWLFGGDGYDSNGSRNILNDLWRYDPATGQWTWVAGSSLIKQSGSYGTKGTGSMVNIPGARDGSLAWANGSGNLWLFGGHGFDKDGTYGTLNDLWRFEPGTGEWSWMEGSDNVDQTGIYGSTGTGIIANIPGARYSSISWANGSGDFWLFGGNGYDRNGLSHMLNDLWAYELATGEWTLMAGSDTLNQAGNYGLQGISSATNVPGPRTSPVAWTDDSGNFWLFGGWGFDKNGAFGNLNDLWRYTSDIGEWTWMGGSDIVDQPGKYGTIGNGNAANIPGAREGSVSWTDALGNLWLFGGYGFDKNDNDDVLNDLWRYEPNTGKWTWVSGSSIAGQPGNYGTLGTGSTTNIPGARYGSISWIDEVGKLWLFGGRGLDKINTYGGLNDLWHYDPDNGEWTWMAGSDLRNQPGIYGTQGTGSAANSPGGREESMSWTDHSGNFWLFGGRGYDNDSFYDHLNDLCHRSLRPP